MVADRRKRRKGLNLSLDELRRLSNRLLRICCSDPWERHCKSMILSGDVLYRSGADQQERELRRTGVYPPGGLLSLMKRCGRCGRQTPPQCVGSSGHCDECRYETMSEGELETFPGSPGTVIDMSRLAASRRRSEPVYRAR